MRQDAQRNRERTIAAAEKVFVEQGAAGSTHEVASALASESVLSSGTSRRKAS